MPMPSQVSELLMMFGEYRSARARFLERIECPASNRDPFAEFSERLVAQLLNGTLRISRVQADYDVSIASGRT